MPSPSFARLALLVALAASLALAGCGDDNESKPADAGRDSGGGDGAVSDSGDSGGDSGDSGGSSGVPTDKDQLFSWLQAATYKSWTHKESAAHASSGPHGTVQTYINDALDSSLSANTDHAVGAAAVKELYSGSDLSGWAVWVKVDADSDSGGAGNGIYWYEIFSTTDGSSPIASSTGANTCVGCHASGKDYFSSPYPLQ